MDTSQLQSELAAHGYEILEQIREGGSRLVFLAKKELVADPVVIKVFKQEGVHERIDRKREQKPLEEILRGELEVIRRFSHPNLVRCFHHGAVNGSYFLEEEYMGGGSLASHLGKLSEDKILQFFVQVTDGVAYLHGRGFYVRDFKLDNILTDTALSIAKLSDLEMAGRIPEGKGTLGSERYSAPELEMGRTSDPVKTDIFALGCGLYYLLTGQAIAMKKLNRLPESWYTPLLATMIESVHERYRATLLACLAYNPEERFSSALDLKESLLDKHPLRTVVFDRKNEQRTHRIYVQKGNVAVRDMEDRDIDAFADILQRCFKEHNIFKKARPLVRTYIVNSHLTFGEKGGGWITYEADGKPEGCLLIRSIDLNTVGTHLRVHYNHLASERGFADDPVVVTLVEAADRKLLDYLRSQEIQTAKVQINLAPDELALLSPLQQAGFTVEGTLTNHYRYQEDVILLGKLVCNFHA